MGYGTSDSPAYVLNSILPKIAKSTKLTDEAVEKELANYNLRLKELLPGVGYPSRQAENDRTRNLLVEGTAKYLRR